ncbi:MAG TPA: chemotaxis protein CheW [Blastocatellia bacterium]|jgi:purine-binding chemotaxis protein CheW
MADKQAADQNTSQAYILFDLAGTTYGVPSRAVQQVELVEQITPVPNAPAAVEGVIFSRGQVIPAVNLRVRFGFEKKPHDLRTRLIVIAAKNRVVGLIVDSAREFLSIPSSAVQPPHEAISGLNGNYLDGIATLGERIILILNLDEVIERTEVILPAPGNA